MMRLSLKQVKSFQEVVWQHYHSHGRAMPWRENPSPYKVLVSELMLQQTQVQRVIPKFGAFIYTCPDFTHLAEKSLSEVLGLWSGLGYNRRAKYLHHTAQIVVGEFAGVLPNTMRDLMQLPGIGKNTAGAILAYAYNEPAVFVETNIRTVLFHHFYANAQKAITDKELEFLVEQTLDRENPRQWYWALMDYGSYLKKAAGGRLATSSHYKRQTPFKGSIREVRGRIIKALLNGALTKGYLLKLVDGDERFDVALNSLIAEGTIEKINSKISLKNTPTYRV